MNRKTTTKKNIRNPEKWIGKYVRHMANWMDYQFGFEKGYVVCEWTGKLITVAESDEAYYGDYFDSKEQAEAAGYDECYCYSHEGLMKMAGFAA